LELTRAPSPDGPFDATTTDVSAEVAQALDLGFNCLADNIPVAGGGGFNEAMSTMMDEILNSDTLIMYLTATNISADDVRVTIIYSISKYSAGFGGSNTLHGITLGLLGEMVGTQLPPLVQFNVDPGEGLVHTVTMEEVIVPMDALVDTYFGSPIARKLMTQPTVAQGGMAMNMSNFCPIPLSWAPYFMDSKAPYQALKVGCSLVATMTGANHRAMASTLLDSLRAACVH
jgi:hypothetical protein